MTKKLLFAVAILCALTFALLAADVSGKWTFEQSMRGNTMTVTLNLKAEGANLTGTVDAGRGGPAEISDGKVDGNTVTFKVSRETPNGTFSTSYKGVVDGDTMKLEVTRPGRNGGEPQTTTVTAKRSTT
jgi:hypothetical protein